MHGGVTNEPDLLVSPCPGCGRPRAVGQGTRTRCEACGQEHPFPPEVLRAAQTYRMERANMPLQIQQASDIAGLTAHATAYLHRFRRAAAVLAAPLLVLFVVGIGWVPSFFHEVPEVDVPRRLYAPAFFAPLLVLIGGGVLAGLRMRRSREAIQSLLWARPLVDVPGAFGCRMCGGPLVGDESRAATIRCTFCRSENMVGPEISRKSASLARTDYAVHAQNVVRRLGVGRGARDDAGRPSWSAWLAISVPLVTVLAAWGIAHYVETSLSSRERPVDLARPYVVWRCPSQPHAQVVKPGRPLPGEGWCQAAEERPVQTSTTLAEILARRGETRVVGTFSDGFGRYWLRTEDFWGTGSLQLANGAVIGAKPSGPR